MEEREMGVETKGDRDRDRQKETMREKSEREKD